MTAPVYADGAAAEIERLAAELASFRAFLTERGCGGVGDANGMHDLAQHHEELIADNERQSARIARLEAALRALIEPFALISNAGLLQYPDTPQPIAILAARAALADAPGEGT